MQRTSLRRVKTSADTLRPNFAEIVHYPLPGLLKANHTLALNTPLGTLSLLSYSVDGPRLIAEQQFTDSEICVLKPLLESHPHFCPYEVLLASFNSGNVTELAIARCRQRLHEAQEAGVWDQEMRPVRNVLSRTRLKMHTFEVDIFSILETGYVLMQRSRYRQKEA
ncbi:MAG: hypothetical protein NVSMB27_25740 [Ktedonobacteraceae bacterium]